MEASDGLRSWVPAPYGAGGGGLSPQLQPLGCVAIAGQVSYLSNRTLKIKNKASRESVFCLFLARPSADSRGTTPGLPT